MSARKTPSSQRTEEFLQVASQFRLGSLVTESPHPRTTELAELCKSDLRTATHLFREIEFEALRVLLRYEDQVSELADSIRRVLEQGRKIYLCGCGATGRLSLVLETIWREAPLGGRGGGYDDSVVAFTAGGDYALVRSLGVFEDNAALGARHLLDLGFQEGDLLIAITEGGETNFVLGALDEASQRSHEKPWLFFCNPPTVLVQVAERSARALANPNVRSLALEIDPMALTGSTRLQASSVLMAFVGAAFQDVATGRRAQWLLTEIVDQVAAFDPAVFAPIIELEASVHQRRGFTLHRSRTAAIAVLTDTTERAPTFSLAPFESAGETLASVDMASRTYLEIPGTRSTEEAWSRLLGGRKPRPFTVPPDVTFAPGVSIPPIGFSAIHGFDFSEGVAARRAVRGLSTELILDVEFDAQGLVLSATDPKGGVLFESSWKIPASPLLRQCLLKYALNLQSTLAMGRIGRYHGNLMTFVRPTNNKLIDRAIRTMRGLSAQSPDPRSQWIAAEATDEVLLESLFAASELVTADEPTVLKAIELLRRAAL